MRKWSVGHSVVSNSLWPCGLQPTRLLCPWISRQEHWSGLPFSPPEDLPDPRIKPGSPALASRFFTIWATQTVALEPSVLVKRDRTLGKFKPRTKLKVVYAVEENLIFLFWTIFFTMKNKVNIKATCQRFLLLPRWSHRNQVYPPAWIIQEMNKNIWWDEHYNCLWSLLGKCFQAKVL